jgi:hypothetical protein
MKKMTICVFEEYIKHSKKILWRMVVKLGKLRLRKRGLSNLKLLHKL